MVTALCQYICGSLACGGGVCEEGAEFASSHDGLDGFLLMTVADDHTDASLQSPRGCFYLRDQTWHQEMVTEKKREGHVD